MFGRADADAAQLALLLQLTQGFQRGGVPVPRAGPGVKLDEVDAVGLEVAQAAFEPLAQVRLPGSGPRSGRKGEGGHAPGDFGGILVAT